MPFKEELEKLRAQRAKEAQAATAQREAAIATIKKRAAELTEHLVREAADTGLIVDHRANRLTLSHPKSKTNIIIDPDTARYTVYQDAPHPSGTRQMVTGTQQSLENVTDIDEYVLEFLDGIDAP
jgi:hypothetical protein